MNSVQRHAHTPHKVRSNVITLLELMQGLIGYKLLLYSDQRLVFILVFPEDGLHEVVAKDEMGGR